MTAPLLFDLGLCLLLVFAALLAVGGRDLFAAIAFFITYGILVALAWLRLGAVDVALAEAAIGAGLTGVLLIGAWSRLRRASQKEEVEADGPKPLPARLGAFLAAGLVAAGLAVASLDPPPLAAGLAPLVAENLALTGVENPVTAVLLNFRAYDTLLESVVLLIALVAVWAATPADLWGGRAGLPQHARPDGVMASFGRLLPPVGLLVAVYMVWAGSDMPGGAFQAGTILAAVLLLVAMAGILPAPRLDSRPLRLALLMGPGFFLLVGLALLPAGAFLGFPTPLAKPLIVAIECALALSIAATLALLVLGPPEPRP